MCTTFPEARCNLPLAHLPLSSKFSDCLCSLQLESQDVVCKCIKELGSSGFNKEGMCASLEGLGKELLHLLVKLRSLPPTVNGLTMELGVLYNFLYASLLKNSIQTHDQTKLLIAHANTALRSLHRAQELVGTHKGASGHASQTNGTYSESATSQVPVLLSDLISILHSVNCTMLHNAVGLFGCLWSLITIMEQGLTTPVTALLPLLDLSHGGDDKIPLKHGFLFSTLASPLLAASNENDQNFVFHGGEPSQSLSVHSLAAILMATSSFHRGELETCREHTSEVTDPKLTSLSALLTARALLEAGECMEAVGILHTSLDRDANGGNADVKSYTYRLLAACYSAQNLPHLAVEMLRCSLQLRSNSVAALYSLAVQFRSMQQYDAEIQCLHMMVKTLEELEHDGSKSAMELPLLDNCLHKIVTAEDELSLPQGLYLLASRCAQLERYKESSECYMQLIQVFQSRECGHHYRVQVPDLLTVCQEATKTLLLSGGHQPCLELCNKVLVAMAASPSSPDLELDQNNLLCAFKSAHDNQSAADLAEGNCEGQMRVTEKEDASQAVKTQRKRRLSSADERETVFDESWETEWRKTKNLALITQYMAEVMVCKGDNAAAVSLLNRSVDRLLACQARSRGQRSKVGEQPVTSNPKRPRFCAGVSGDGDDVKDDDSDWSRLTCSVCVKMADLVLRLEDDGQALHFSRLAAQLQPDSESAQYFLSSALHRVGRGSEGCQQWLRLRRLPHNTGSVHLGTTLQQRQEALRSLCEDSSEDARGLGVVTTRQKLHLDVTCLTILSDGKRKK